MTFKVKHGHSTRSASAQSATYGSWLSMRARCLKQTNKQFAYYGGRGILICDRWHDFANFLADMGDTPEGKSLDRIDNNGNYEPSNCRWATAKEQATNRRNNHWIEFRGVRRTIGDWSRSLGLSADALGRRFKLGWPIDIALTAPRSRPWEQRKNFQKETT